MHTQRCTALSECTALDVHACDTPVTRLCVCLEGLLCLVPVELMDDHPSSVQVGRRSTLPESIVDAAHNRHVW